MLRPDIERLARLFATLAATSALRLRLEHVAERTCPGNDWAAFDDLPRVRQRISNRATIHRR